MNITKLALVMLLDMVLIVIYVLLVVINVLDNLYFIKYWYQLLLILIGFIGLNNAYLVKSKILFVMGMVLISVGLYNIM